MSACSAMTSSAADLELARALLIAHKEATCVAVRGDEIHIITERGVKPLLKMVSEGCNLKGFSVADKVVGKAPALLYAVLGPSAVFSPVMSWTGRAVLLCAGIATSYDQLVPHIQNRANTGQCPMDSSVEDVFDPYEAVDVLKSRAQQLAL
ncbi:DUF1893 domain-containing protein [Olsenella profusa]|uniref:DUF1893 domain-containing protein n=1 Tax=Olsenella profusa TaxID=138595 RepID=A0ABS2F3G7_9ACTN|nr:DUF1893 domain-containing protein [Olsenella profusa]MBM6775083.1 DUF1893 domain-containing protein [Olsenella profusa]